MQFSFHPKRGNFFNKDKTFTSESDLSKDEEFETQLGRNVSIPEPANLMARKAQGNAGGLRKKSILKNNYKNSEQNSVDEGYPKHNTYFLDKGGAHLDVASELSEIEKVASIMNRTDEYIVKEENSQAEHTPQNRIPTRIPNFGLLSKFSPEKQQQTQANQSLDISSPISQGYPDHDARQDTEDGKGIIGNIMKITDKGKLFPPPGLSLDIAKTKTSTERNQLTETPLFKTEKVKQTTESNSAQLTSLTGVVEEKPSLMAPPQNINLNNVNREEVRKGSYAEGTLDSHATRKLNDSNISRKHHKKATLFAMENRNGHIIPGYTRYVLDENVNQQQVYMPHFSDKEISEAFATLDINKDGYITADEITYFLEVLEENANEAEIEEMIRMLDYEGTGRVRYEEFYKMSTGKNLNPIGQAYPPTLDLFEKKKNADLVRKMRLEAQSELMARENSKNQSGRGYFGNRSEMDSRYYGKIDSKLNKLPRLGNLGDEGVKYKKTDKDETDTYFKGFIRQAGLNMKIYMEKYDIVQFSPEQRVAKVPYKDFLGFFVIDDQDVTKKVFSILGNDRNTIDMRQIMIALSLYLDFTPDEKISLAYDLFDPEGHGYILYNELMKTFMIFQLGEDMKKIEKKITAILNRRSIMPEDSIPKEEFMVICKNFPDLFTV